VRKKRTSSLCCFGEGRVKRKKENKAAQQLDEGISGKKEKTEKNLLRKQKKRKEEG